jgi:hypothetical protein
MNGSPGRTFDRRPFPLAPLLALVVLLTPGAVGSLAVPGVRPPVAPPGADVFEVEAAELLARPSLYVGQVRRLPATFAGWTEAWNPFLTRFGPRDYRAFLAWSDAQFLWEGGENEPSLRLFVRRGSAVEWALEEAQVHVRYELTVAVREVFAGRPWCEVIAARPLAETLGEGALVHAQRAYKALGAGQWRRAEAELERALAAPLPPKARAELERLLGICDRRLRPHGHDPADLRRQ